MRGGFSMEAILQKSVNKLHDIFDKTDLDAEWKKIQIKFEEAKYNPGDVTPLADSIFSILLAAKSRGFSVKAVLQELERVAEKNLKRKWKKMPDGTYQAM
jgi:hypothetical protein